MNNSTQTVQNQDFSSNLLYQIKELENMMLNSQTTHSSNESVFRSFDYLLEKLKLIYRLFQQSIRFDWVLIQQEMDRLYQEDSTITGYSIYFDFINTKGFNRAHIQFNQHNQN